MRGAPVRAVLATPNFSNPLGALMPDENKERLVKMLTRRDIPLIEDDVYGELAFDGTRPRPAKAFDTAGLVLLCGSVSKTLAPGYRVGWVAPGRYRDARREAEVRAQRRVARRRTQMAVAEFLAAGGYDRHLRRLRRVARRAVARYREAIAQHFPEGTRVSRPQGGFVLWVELGDETGASGARRGTRSTSSSARSIAASRSRRAHVLGAPAVRALHPHQHRPPVVAAHRARDRDARAAALASAGRGGRSSADAAISRRRGFGESEERLDGEREPRIERSRQREQQILGAVALTLRRSAARELSERDAKQLVRGTTDRAQPADESHATRFGRRPPDARRPERTRRRETRAREQTLDVRRRHHEVGEQRLRERREERRIVEERERARRRRVDARHEAHHARGDLVDVASLEERAERPLLGSTALSRAARNCATATAASALS